MAYELVLSGTPTFNGDGSCTINSTGSDRVQAPALYLDETQSWIAMRIKLGFDPNSDGAVRSFFRWYDSGSNEVTGYYPASGLSVFRTYRVGGGAGAHYAETSTVGISSGDTVTVVFAWTAGELKISLNGAAFGTEGQATVPVLADQWIDIGSNVTAEYMNSDFFWVAFGTGTLTTGNAATIHAFGDAGPTNLLDLPGTPTLLWHATSASYLQRWPFVNVAVAI